jgi:Fe2+ transport system protein FeoA
VESEVLAAFFSAVNTMVDDLQESMRKGRDVSNMNRVLTSENSSILLHYQPNARVLVCAIADPEDDSEVIVKVLQQIGKRFWKKHRKDLELFKTLSENRVFSTFIIDIENLARGGKVGEIHIDLQIAKAALERVLAMGVINESEFQVAKAVQEFHSPLEIAKHVGISATEANNLLKKLMELDIVKIQRG